MVNAIKNGETPPPYKVDDLISLDSSMPNLEKLKYELAIPMRDFDNNGRVKVESKKDLAKRDIKSPNIADAFIMSFAPVQAGLQHQPRYFRTAMTKQKNQFRLKWKDRRLFLMAYGLKSSGIHGCC